MLDHIASRNDFACSEADRRIAPAPAGGHRSQSPGATRLVSAVAEAIARDDLKSLPRIGRAVHVSGLMEFLLAAYDRIAPGDIKPSE